MNIVQNSLTAVGVAVLIAGAVPNPARASEKPILNPLQIEKSAGTIILAESKAKSKRIHKSNVILKRYDPVHTESGDFGSSWAFGPESTQQ
jgi:hypothetical protein